MGNRLPVMCSETPYRYVSDNLAAVREEFFRVSAECVEGGCDLRLIGRLRELLGLYETLLSVKEGFKRNGWID